MQQLKNVILSQQHFILEFSKYDFDAKMDSREEYLPEAKKLLRFMDIACPGKL